MFEYMNVYVWFKTAATRTDLLVELFYFFVKNPNISDLKNWKIKSLCHLFWSGASN